MSDEEWLANQVLSQPVSQPDLRAAACEIVDALQRAKTRR
jgi:hypothetical protein